MKNARELEKKDSEHAHGFFTAQLAQRFICIDL